MQLKDDQRFPRLKWWLYPEKDEYYPRYEARVASHPSLKVNHNFLEGQGYGGSPFERVNYKWLEAQHFGKYPKNPIRKLVAIVTVKDKLEGKTMQSVVVDGQHPWENWFDEVREVVLSPDGSRVAAVVSVDGSQTIVVNDQQWATKFDHLFHWSPQFSPSSRRLAVSVVKDGNVIVVVDDEPWSHLSRSFPRRAYPMGSYDSLSCNVNNDRIYSPNFGPDDTCAVVMPKRFPSEWTVAVEGKLWPRAFPWVHGFWMEFSKDGHIAVPVDLREYKIGDENRQTVAIDGEPWTELHYVIKLSFLPNGQLAAIASKYFDNPDQSAWIKRVEKSTVIVADQALGWIPGSTISLEYEVKRHGFSKGFTIIGYEWKERRKIQHLKQTYSIS